MATALGERIIAYRKEHKLSRKAFADKTGLTPAKLFNIEEKRDPRPDELIGIEQLLGGNLEAAIEEVFSQDDVVFPEPTAEDIFIEGLEDPEEEFATWTEIEPAEQPAPPSSDGTPSWVGPVREQDSSPAEEDITAVLSTPEKEAEQQLVNDKIASFDGRLFANSELRTLKRCKRKWYLAFYRRLGQKFEAVTGTRQLGTRVHSALAVYYDPADTRDPFVVLKAEGVRDHGKIHPADHIAHEELEKEVAFATIMVEGYFEWLAETGADADIEIIDAEATLVAPFPDGTVPGYGNVGMVGKLDTRIIRHQDNARLFMDHKTVGDLVKPTRTLHMDEQMMQYHLLELLEMLAQGQDPAAGEKTDGGLYNMLKKVKRTDRAKPPFYERAEVHHNIHTLRSFWYRIVGEMLEIIELTKKLDEGQDHRMVVPPNPTGDCTWDCDFFHVCPMHDDGSRVEDFIKEHLVEVNPLRRYQKETVL